MGIFDFIFGNKKKEEAAKLERERQEKLKKEQEEKARLEAERAKREREATSIEPFVFKSNCHQRYEHDIPVKGLQQCSRTVSVEKNVNGCKGYKITPEVGYIVKIYNDDQGQPNMSDKPMKVVKKQGNMVLLQGYPLEAQTPFGWQSIDYSDYGLSVIFSGSAVQKCTLFMYDRGIRIEYMVQDESCKKTSSTPNTSKNKTPSIPEAEFYVNEALNQLQLGNDGDATYHPLYKAWKSICNDPKQLRRCKNIGNIGMGMSIFLSYGTVHDIDERQQIASIGYLCLSLALKTSPNDVNLLKNRLILMLTNKEAFQYTVSSVVNGEKDFCMTMTFGSFEARDALYKMEYADLAKDLRLLSVGMFADAYNDLKKKINDEFFKPDVTSEAVIVKGNKHHADVLKYLENKVIENEDVDF